MGSKCSYPMVIVTAFDRLVFTWSRNHHLDIATPFLGSCGDQTTQSRHTGSFPIHHAGGILLRSAEFGLTPEFNVSTFTDHISPNWSRPYPSLVTSIGLSQLLFSVRLEIDAGS